MAKKIGFLISGIVVLVLISGGFFYWQNNQADVRELNKTLPAGVKVAKSLIGAEYKVVNKIDGYEFKVPMEWRGVNEVEYIVEREERGYVGTSLNLKGEESLGKVIGIDRFKSGGNASVGLESWAKIEFTTFGLVGDFIKDKIGELEVVKTQENIHFGGEYIYFFRNNTSVYSITGPSDEFIRYIIANGQW